MRLPRPSRPGHGLLVALALGLLCADLSQAAESAWSGTERGAVRLVTATDGAGSAASIEAGLQIRLAPGWHTYWRSPGDAGVAPRIDFGASQNVTGVTVAWPAPSRIVISGLRSNVYSGGVTLPVSVAVAQPGAPVRLRASMDYAICANVCIPARAELSLDLPAGPDAPAARAAELSEARAMVPADLTSAGLRVALSRHSDGPAGSLVSLLLRHETGRFTAPQLFVEGVGADEPASTVRLDDEGRAAWLRIVVPASEAAHPLTLTLVYEGKAVTWTAPGRP